MVGFFITPKVFALQVRNSCVRRRANHNLIKCMTLVPALGRQRQVDLCEFEASLLYRASEFQDSQGYTEKPCPEKNK